MSSLDSIIQVNITRETKVPTRVGFGTAAFVSNNAVFQGRHKRYGSLQEVTDDPLAGADTLQFALRYFGQDVAPEFLHVVKKGRDLPQIMTITFDADFVTGNTISGTVNGVAITPVPFNTDHATTLADLATELQASAAIVTATVTGARQITATGANGSTFPVSLSVAGGASQADDTQVVTQYADSVLTIVASLADAQNVNDDWYAVAIYSRADADILAVAAWVETQTKIFGSSSNDADVIGSGSSDIASQLAALNYDRTFYLYSASADGSANDPYPEAAWLGGQLPQDPGSITWAHKELAGVASNNLTSGQETNALEKQANIYVPLAGLDITKFGTVASGEYIDIIHGADWIKVRMQEEIFFVLANAPKVPYTNAGIGQIENAERKVLQRAVNMGILASYTVTSPDAADISAIDKGNRLLPDMQFEGVLAGAIHKARIAGRLVL